VPSDAEIRGRVDSIVWHHSIDLGNGLVTDGLSKEFLSPAQLPDFAGRTVLDIGAWDGYYSFLAERSGASRVLALDHYAWGVDFARRNPYWDECFANGVLPDHGLDTTEFWDPALPGMAGFNLAKEILDSKVEAVVDDFAIMDVAPLGQFDVVLFLGVLYHLKEPLTVLERLRRITGQVAVIETEALLLPPCESRSILEFTAANYGPGHDYGNWYTPNLEGLHQLCRAAGFSRIDTIIGPPSLEPPAPASSSPASPASPAGSRLRHAVGRRLRPAPPQPPAPRPHRNHYRALVHAFP